jgi:hypothetical protein
MRKRYQYCRIKNKVENKMEERSWGYLNLVPGQRDPVQKGLSTDVAAGARAGARA